MRRQTKEDPLLVIGPGNSTGCISYGPFLDIRACTISTSFSLVALPPLWYKTGPSPSRGGSIPPPGPQALVQFPPLPKHPFWRVLRTGEIPALPPPGLRRLGPRLIINILPVPAQRQPHPPMSKVWENPGKGAMRKKPRAEHTSTCPPAAPCLSARRAPGPWSSC